MVQTFRFIGTESVVGGTKMRRFGQRFQMEAKAAEMLQKGGCPIISEMDFQSFSFSEDDLKIWSDSMLSDHDVPADKNEAEQKEAFIQKREAARALFCQIRHELLDEADKPNTNPTPVELPKDAIVLIEGGF